MISSIISLVTLLSATTAHPAPQAQGPEGPGGEIWAVNNFQIFSSLSTGMASIGFKTDAHEDITQKDKYECNSIGKPQSDGGSPKYVNNPCGVTGTVFNFFPAYDGIDFHSLMVIPYGTPPKLGVATFPKDSLKLDNGVETWVGKSDFNITNIFPVTSDLVARLSLGGEMVRMA
ncbi:hypothetical protein F4777DRAFT_75789 [Nemania sp. FL0916]|nr:hypothetical protein F4777DRAFT_75789 [Nemania sp. FL0916]